MTLNTHTQNLTNQPSRPHKQNPAHNHNPSCPLGSELNLTIKTADVTIKLSYLYLSIRGGYFCSSIRQLISCTYITFGKPAQSQA